jgi:hypothetical protein
VKNENAARTPNRVRAAFSGSLRGLELASLKWRYLIPLASIPQGHNVSFTY